MLAFGMHNTRLLTLKHEECKESKKACAAPTRAFKAAGSEVSGVERGPNYLLNTQYDSMG